MEKLLCLFFFLPFVSLTAQDFYLGADLSYVNEMEDCGVVYREGNQPKDPYTLFADRGANLIRLRLWHKPAWYDELNEGRRYSDLADVKRSIRRAKAADMQVLLDFHFSDFWTDPSRQIVPNAWAEVVDNLPVLQDSLYQYVRATLLDLSAEGLLPDMIQVGNETNKGIMQSEEADAAGWALDWPRNAALFNTAIGAIREIEEEANKEIKIALHIAGPENAAWLLAGFWDNGVRDFDLVGLSYYWAWHQPTTIERTGEIIAEIKRDFPGKQVMIFETGYIWTTEANDEANNIISSVQEGYAPASPEQQRRWLIDLAQEVYNREGLGVLYWEPAWVSSGCYTQWGRGSHQEHAAFFDFTNNLLEEGGIGFLSHDYAGSVATRPGLATA
ncbi:MAG: glycosyl hydrolase 53 family protein, partial [Bacteroidota bacterium]